MISRKSQWIIFAAVNLTIVFGVLLFPFYLAVAKLIPIGKCAMVDFGLYCPACGGTRALSALLRFELIDALIYNPIVPYCAAAVAVYEVYMITHLIKGGERQLFWNRNLTYIFFICWAIYFALRNVLLLFGIDLIGDILI